MAKRNGGRAAQAAPAAAEAPAKPAEQERGNRPVKEIRLGRVRASIWSNSNSKQEQWYSVVLTRGYKDAEGQWKNSHSLGLDDLLVAGEVLRQAALWIYRERQGENRAQAQQQSSGAGVAQEGGADEPIPFDQNHAFPANDASPYEHGA